MMAAKHVPPGTLLFFITFFIHDKQKSIRFFNHNVKQALMEQPGDSVSSIWYIVGVAS